MHQKLTNLLLLVAVLALTGCTAPATQKSSDLPITMVCMFASCSVNSNDRGAAQDEVGGDLAIERNENTDQKAVDANETDPTLPL